MTYTPYCYVPLLQTVQRLWSSYSLLEQIPTIRTSENGDTPLIIACRIESISIANMLLTC